MTKKITYTAILLALYLIIKTISPTIRIIAGVININIAIIIMPLIGMLVGPKYGFLIGVLADLISFMLAPTVFNPIFTLNEGLLGVFGGLLLHQKNLTLKHTILSSMLTCYLGIVCMNTLALIFQYTILVPSGDKLSAVLTTSLFIRFCSSTFIYIPLLSTLIYLPRKQWKLLQQRVGM